MDYHGLQEKVRLGWEGRGFPASACDDIEVCALGTFSHALPPLPSFKGFRSRKVGDALASQSCLGQWEFREVGINYVSQQYLHAYAAPTVIQSNCEAGRLSEMKF